MFVIACLASPGLYAQTLQPASANQSINTVIGDESFENTFGVKPSAQLDETLRIQIHLLYVYQLLQQRNTDQLTNQQREKRAQVLELLTQYMQAADFPANTAYPDQRRPCFIDNNGNICAVGYLLEQTKGRAAAEYINSRHQYDYLMDMNEPMLATWANEYGLTLEECAMIQPTYGPIPPLPGEEIIYMDIKPGYGAASGIAGGANLALTINMLGRGSKLSRGFHYVSLATGTGQLIMGLVNIRKSTSTPTLYGTNIHTSYKKQNNLSYANIAMGTTTLLSSVINLAMHKTSTDQRHSYNLYSHPNTSNQLTVGIQFTRRL